MREVRVAVVRALHDPSGLERLVEVGHRDRGGGDRNRWTLSGGSGFRLTRAGEERESQEADGGGPQQ
jgi:hypothetical protein